MNSVNVQYEDEVNLTHEITTIIVRSSSSDPYTTTNAETFLDQFKDEWNSNQGSISRDVAHLFTGKSIQGGTIGIAWLGVVCFTNSAYGLVESDCCGSLVARQICLHMKLAITGVLVTSQTLRITRCILHYNAQTCLQAVQLIRLQTMRIVPVASIAKIKLRRALVVYQEDNASKYINQTVKPEMGR